MSIISFVNKAKQTATTPQLFHPDYVARLIVSLFIFFLTRYAVTYGAGSDPRYTLIVAQSILDNGTVQLNGYQDKEIWGAPADFDGNINILKVNGRYYNYFPVGPSLLSLPFVILTKTVGWDMLQAQDNINAQRLLASFSAIAVFWILYHISRVYLPHRDSLLLTAVSLFGTTLISTLGVAWWSINLSVIFISLALLLLVRYDSGQAISVQPWLLGSLLFLAYFTRAAAAAFIAPALLYLAWKDWRQMAKTAVIAATLLALFLLWSQREFGTWLPIYYSAVRLQIARPPIWLALLGHLFSSARGLFVFSPFFLLLIPGLWLLRRQARPPLLWLCLAWLALHLYVSSRGTNWWGGDSFGPRILTELVLPLTLLLVWAWREGRTLLSPRQQRGWLGLYGLLGLTAVFIHSYQGLYNYSTILWNEVTQEYPVPPFTPRHGDLFNWRYPQVLASNAMLCAVDRERAAAILAQQSPLAPYEWGSPLPFDSAATSYALLAAQRDQPTATLQLPALFVGWEPVDNDRAPYRTTQCDQIAVYLRLTAVPTTPTTLLIRASAFGSQRAVVALNGQPVGEMHFTQQPKLAAETAVLPLASALLRPNAVNKLSISLPDAHRAKVNDPTRLSLAIADMSICPVDVAATSTDTYNCPSISNE